MHVFQSHSGLHRTFFLHQFPNLGSYKYTLLYFCITHVWELIPHIFESMAGFIHIFHKVFHEAQLYVQKGQINFLRKNKRRIDDIVSPVFSGVRLSHRFLHSDSSCPGCPTRTGNSSILCTRLAFRVTVKQP